MDKYAEIVKGIAVVIKSYGFVRKGNTFYLSRSGNWAILNFQKSKTQTHGQISFTINIGILSSKVREFLANDTTPFPRLDLDDCHWKKRIGHMLPQKQDYWWNIGPDTSLEKVREEIVNIINTIVLPEINDNISDEALERNWLSGNSEGLTDMEYFIFMSALLKMYNRDSLSNVIDRFKTFSRGKPYEEVANEHIDKIKNYDR